MAQNSPEGSNRDEGIDLLDGSYGGDDAPPKIRLKVPQPDAIADQAPIADVSELDAMEGQTDLATGVKIVMC